MDSEFRRSGPASRLFKVVRTCSGIRWGCVLYPEAGEGCRLGFINRETSDCAALLGRLLARLFGLESLPARFRSSVGLGTEVR